MSTTDHLISVDQSCYVYQLLFKEMTQREGELLTDFEGVKNIGLISTYELPEVSNLNNLSFLFYKRVSNIIMRVLYDF